MRYYILHRDNLECEEIAKADFFKWISINDPDYIYITYDKATGRISSLDDISGYWFHVLGGELHWAIQTNELHAIEYLERLSDSEFGRNLWNYEASINNNQKHDILTIVKEIQDINDSWQQHKYDYSRRD